MTTLASIPDALVALRAGRPVLVTDDEDRENEGDDILAAATTTQEWLAWTIRHSSGVVCAPMPDEVADRLALPPMVARASGSLLSFTLYCFSTSGSTSFSTNSAYRPDMVSYSKPRSLPWASPLPLLMETAIITGTRCWAIRVSNAVNKRGSGPSAPTMNGATVPGTYCLGTYTVTRRE